MRSQSDTPPKFANTLSGQSEQREDTEINMPCHSGRSSIFFAESPQVTSCQAHISIYLVFGRFGIQISPILQTICKLRVCLSSAFWEPLGASYAPAARIQAVRLDRNSEQTNGDLERFLHSMDTKPLLTALEKLSETEQLWIGALRTDPSSRSIQSIELTPWRNQRGTIARWFWLDRRRRGRRATSSYLES